ncbi:MAG: hypothetical protein ACYSOZ_08835 [Planctomycetota bacterium]
MGFRNRSMAYSLSHCQVLQQSVFFRGKLYRQTVLENPNKNRTNIEKERYFFDGRNMDKPFSEEKKTARTSQKEEEVGELPRATEVTGGRRSLKNRR